MWRFHTEYEKEPWDIVQFTEENTLEEVVGKRLATACYPEHSLPLLLYLIYINQGKFSQSLFDNANAGGDNVHRGMAAGMIAGAANDSIPQELMEGLSDFEQIKSEIESFVDVALTNN